MPEFSASLASPTWVGVLDLLGGQVVRAIGGQRANYQPWQPLGLNTSDPRVIAESFRDRHGIDTLYIADLDALAGRPPEEKCIKQLVSDGFHVTLDRGPRTTAQLEDALDTGAQTVVISLEAAPTWAHLRDWCAIFDTNRLAFGLDLFAGAPFAPLPLPDTHHPSADSPHSNEDLPALAQALATLHIPKIIILDLHAVGRQLGPTTLPYCRTLHQTQPTLQIWTGGGFRNQHDIDEATASGVTGVLLATALHEGSLTRQTHPPINSSPSKHACNQQFVKQPTLPPPPTESTG